MRVVWIILICIWVGLVVFVLAVSGIRGLLGCFFYSLRVNTKNEELRQNLIDKEIENKINENNE